jgi:carbamoyltransferase
MSTPTHKSYLGLSCTCHDAALAIVNDQGEVIFAEAAERYLQNKRAWCSSADDFLRMEQLLETYCPNTTHLVLASTWRSLTLNLARFLSDSPLVQNPIVQTLNHRLSSETPFPKLISQFLATYTANHVGLNAELMFFIHHGLQSYYSEADQGKSCQVTRKSYDHHLTHAAAACYSSPFTEALCVIVDGYGERGSTAAFRYQGGRLEPLPGVASSRPSLGLFYAALCEACGFSAWKGEEWKVMGLAPYGQLNRTFYHALKGLMEVKEGRFVYKPRASVKAYERFLYEQIQYEGTNPYEAADLAYTGQVVFEEWFGDLLRDLHRHCPTENLVLSGGCALNSVFNGKVVEQVGGIKHCYVFSAPGDDGNAVGAALLAYYDDRPPQAAPAILRSPYLGSSLSVVTRKNLERYSPLQPLALEPGETVPAKTAQLLATGNIVGWVQGRAEFGPRALGNRSILADPRLPDMKKRLNAEVKYREEFRPFAPAILHEYGSNYFENYQETPYMERALRFRPEVIAKVPGVVHVDGTGRLQTVKREWNALFYDLIWAFLQLTGVPILLNTSFNVMGKPIVHSLEDAVAVFMTSGLDVLVVEDQIYCK